MVLRNLSSRAELCRRAVVVTLLLTLPVAAGAQFAQSFNSMQRAAESGDAAAQHRLGLAYRDGIGVSPNLSAAYFWLSMAVSSETEASQPFREPLRTLQIGMTPAQIDAADRYGVAELQRLAQAGRAWAQAHLGVSYHRGMSAHTPRDAALGIEWLHKAAAQDFAGAQYYLGEIYERGDGVRPDAAKAVQWYRAAARGDHPVAQLMLGTAYFEGSSVKADHKQALYWWRRAADQGVTAAEVNLGNMYRFGGNGVAQDFAEAARWFRLAAAKGHASAQSSLGVLHERGLGVLQDASEAARWYRLSAEQGYPLGQLNFGVVLADGHGVAADLVEAHKWLNLAAARAPAEHQKSIADVRDRVAQKMTPAEIAEAQRRARGWLEAFAQGGVSDGVAPSSSIPLPPPPPPPPAAPIRVGGDIAAPTKTRHVDPIYPPIAQSARVQGSVIIEATIGADGKIVDAKVLRSIPLLDKAALDAVHQWEFTPTLLNGVPVPVIMTVTVSFTLK